MATNGYNAVACGTPNAIPNSHAQKVRSATSWGSQTLVVKPTRPKQQENAAWAFNEYLAGRLAGCLGVPCLPAFILRGVREQPLVGIPFVKNASTLKDYLETHNSVDWQSVSNADSLASIIAFDSCIFNSDRRSNNIFLVHDSNPSSSWIIGFDHEKSFIGNGGSDLHRIKGVPCDKKIADFCKDEILKELCLVPSMESPDVARAKIESWLKQYTEVLPHIINFVIKDIPDSWKDACPIDDLCRFLKQWWAEIPALAKQQLPRCLKCAR